MRDIDSVLETVKKLQEPDPQLFADVAEKAVKCCLPIRNMNTSTQIRRFYDELARWDDRVNLKKTDFSKASPYIQMLRAKTAYARGRELLSEDFARLMDCLIKGIENPETLKNAKLFLEAYIGYLRAEELKNKKVHS